MQTVSSTGSTRESVVLENNGQKIFGIFHKPITTSRFPVVLICHGLGGNKVGRYRIYVDISNQLAKHGIGSLRIDNRGCGDSDGEFNEMTLESVLSDTKMAFEYLSKLPQVDQDHIGVIGRSLGGAVAVMAASEFPKIKTFCLWAPIYSGAQWKEKWEKLNRDHMIGQQREDFMTVNGQTPGYEFYKQFFRLEMERYLSAINNLPLFIIYGSKDELVDPSHSEQYMQKRKSAPALTHLIKLPQSDHDFTPIVERRKAIEETAKWFVKTI